LVRERTLQRPRMRMLDGAAGVAAQLDRREVEPRAPLPVLPLRGAVPLRGLLQHTLQAARKVGRRRCRGSLRLRRLRLGLALLLRDERRGDTPTEGLESEQG